MGNLTDSADGDNFYYVSYTITTQDEVINEKIGIAAQDEEEALMLVQDMYSTEDLLREACLPANGGKITWGDVELYEEGNDA